MMLHIMLGLQLLFTTTVEPNENINREVMNNSTNSNLRSFENEEEFSSMMQKYVAYNLWANQQLSENRAEAVKNLFVTQGLANENINIQVFGEEKPTSLFKMIKETSIQNPANIH